MDITDIWYSSTYNVAAFVICFAALLYTLLKGRTIRKQNKLFILIICAIMVSAVCTVISVFAEAVSLVDIYARSAGRVTEYVYFIGHTALGPLMFFYSLYVCDADEDVGDMAKRLALLPGILVEILVLVNPFTHLVYSFDEQYRFQRGPLEVTLYLMAVFYAVLSAIILIRYRRTTSFERKVSVLCFYGLTAVGMLVQMFTETVRVELFAEALSLTGLMFSVENDDKGLDLTTGVRNRNALQADLKRFYGRNRPFEVVTLRLMDAATLQRILGFSGYDAVPAMVAEYLMTIHPSTHIYRAAPDAFMLIIPRDETRMSDIRNKIMDRFSHSFSYGSFEGMLRYYLLRAKVPEELDSMSSLLLMADIPIPSYVRSHVLEGRDLSFLLRNTALEKALRDAVANRSFSIAYQEIFNTETGDIAAVEAILLLYDEALGTVYPDEFIPVARQCNLLEEVGMFLLRESFKYFGCTEGVKERVRRLNVNIFSVLLADEDRKLLLSDLCNRYNVSPEEVTLEVTESDTAENPEIMKTAVGELRGMGFKVGLDDYGSGYSNIQEMFLLPFNEVKLSGSFLREAGTNLVSDAVLESNVKMLQEMGLTVLADGVDSEEQIKTVERLKVAFYQGAYEGGVK